MGNICTNNFEKQQTTETVDPSRNAVKINVTLGNSCSIDLISGNYRQNKSDSLLVITQFKNLQHCDPIRQYVNDSQKTIDLIVSQRKIFLKVNPNKSCPYKKLLFAILPKYMSQQSQQYQQNLKNIMRQVMSNSKQISIQLTHTIDGIHQIPNQMILSIILRQLQQISFPIKVNLITNQKKMMNLYKYQLLKMDKCKLRFTQQNNKEGF